jgi:hypothetical protein
VAGLLPLGLSRTVACCCAPVKSGRWQRSAVPLVVVYRRAAVRAVVAVFKALLLAC